MNLDFSYEGYYRSMMRDLRTLQRLVIEREALREQLKGHQQDAARDKAEVEMLKALIKGEEGRL